MRTWSQGAVGVVGEGLIELAAASDRDDVVLAAGGDAANACVMAARVGARVRLAGRVGDDALGRRLERFWTRSGVDLAWLRRDRDAATGLYVNEALPDGGHRFTYWRSGSAGSRLQPDDLDTAFFDGLDVLAVTGVTLAASRSSAAAAHAAIQHARSAGALVCCVLNHRPALGGDVDELARVASGSDILIASVEDAVAVFGEADPTALAALGPSEVVISHGAGGATMFAERVATQPAPVVRARNAAGAGDALAGAYLATRLEGRSPAESLAWGVAAASLSVQRDGCACSYPSRDETDRAVRSLLRAAA